jgi:hypothetical protein
VTEGGTTIPYWLEDPHIRKEYQELLKRNSVPDRMDPDWYNIPAEFMAKFGPKK